MHFLYQDRAEPVSSSTVPEMPWLQETITPPRRFPQFQPWVGIEEPIPTSTVPDLPWLQETTTPPRRFPQTQSWASNEDPITASVVPDLPWLQDALAPPRRTPVLYSWAGVEEPIPAPSLPELAWQPTYPVRIDPRVGLDVSRLPGWSPQPILPLPDFFPYLRERPDVILSLDEEESGSILATLRDDQGHIVSPAVLTDLRLSLVMITAAGVLVPINGRDNQDVFNVNDVTVYPTLQTRGGYTFNLRWAVQPGDTTLVEDTPFARHLGLLTYRWNGGRDYLVIHLIVRNLGQVS